MFNRRSYQLSHKMSDNEELQYTAVIQYTDVCEPNGGIED
jgi:hypothetical protein